MTSFTQFYNVSGLKCPASSTSAVQKGEADKNVAFVILCAYRHMIKISGKCAVQPRSSKKGFRIKPHSPDKTLTQ